MNSFGLRFCYFASSFQRLYCLSVEQRYGNFSFLQIFSRECWLVMGLCPLIPLCFFRGMPKGVGEPGGFFMGLCPLILLVCYFSLLRQRKVTKRKASPARTAVLSGRHVDAGFSARPPPTLRAWPTPDGARASHERAPALRSVPPAVLLMRIATLAHRGRLRRCSTRKKSEI